MMKRMVLWVLVAGAAGACDTPAPAPPLPSPEKVVISEKPTGDPAMGPRLFREKECAACHGPTALGGMGGPLAGTGLSFKQFLSKIRNAIPPKPAMTENDLSEDQAYSIYLWLRALGPEPSGTMRKREQATLPAGQILGIQIWNEKGCGKCHGAFAQGSATAPALAGQNYPFERQRALMRRLAAKNPAHSEKNIPDNLLKRLLNWLRRGADPASGC